MSSKSSAPLLNENVETVELRVEHAKDWMNALESKFDMHISLQDGLEAITRCTSDQALRSQQSKEASITAAEMALSDAPRHTNFSKLLSAFGSVKKMDQLNDKVVLAVAKKIPGGMSRLHKFERDVMENIQVIQDTLKSKEAEINTLCQDLSQKESSYVRICDHLTSILTDPKSADRVPSTLLDEFIQVEVAMANSVKNANKIRKAFRSDAELWLSEIRDVEKQRQELLCDSFSFVGFSFDNSISCRGEFIADSVAELASITGENILSDIGTLSTEIDVKYITHQTAEIMYERVLSDVSHVVEALTLYSSQLQITIGLLNQISEFNDANGREMRSVLNEHSMLRHEAGHVGIKLNVQNVASLGSARSCSQVSGPARGSEDSSSRHSESSIKNESQVGILAPSQNLFEYESRSAANAWQSLFQTLLFFADPELGLSSQSQNQLETDSEGGENESDSKNKERLEVRGGNDDTADPATGAPCADMLSESTVEDKPAAAAKVVRCNDGFITSLSAIFDKLQAMKVDVLAPQQMHSDQVERHRSKVATLTNRISNLESEIEERHSMLEELGAPASTPASPVADSSANSAAGSSGFHQLNKQDKVIFISQIKAKINTLEKDLHEAQERREEELGKTEEACMKAATALWAELKTFRDTFATHVEHGLEVLLRIFGSQRRELALLQQGLSALRADIGGKNVEKDVNSFLLYARKKVEALSELSIIKDTELHLKNSESIQTLRGLKKLPSIEIALQAAQEEAEPEPTGTTTHRLLPALSNPVVGDSNGPSRRPSKITVGSLGNFPLSSQDALQTGTTDSTTPGSSPGAKFDSPRVPGSGSNRRGSDTRVDPSRILGIGSSPDNSLYDSQSGKYIAHGASSGSQAHAAGIAPNPKDDLALIRDLLLPESERIIYWYNCCIFPQPWVLVQGTCYITQKFFAFRGWPDTSCKRLLPLREITHIEKANTAMVVPNAIRIHMLSGVEHFFASFVERDPCFKRLNASIDAEKQFDGVRVAETLRKASDGVDSLEEAKRARAEAAKLQDEKEKEEKRVRDLELMREREEREKLRLDQQRKIQGVDSSNTLLGGSAASIFNTPYAAPTDNGAVFDRLLEKASAATLLDREIAVTPRQLWTRYWLPQAGFRAFLQAEGDSNIVMEEEWVSRGANGKACSHDESGILFQASRAVRFKHVRTGMSIIGPRSAQADTVQYAYLAGEGSEPFIANLQGSNTQIEDPHSAANKPFCGIVMNVLSFKEPPMSSTFKVLKYYLFEPSILRPATHCRVRLAYHVCFVKSSVLTTSIEQGTQGEIESLAKRWGEWVEHYVQEQEQIAVEASRALQKVANDTVVSHVDTVPKQSFLRLVVQFVYGLFEILMQKPHFALAALVSLLLIIISYQWRVSRSLYAVIRTQEELLKKLATTSGQCH